MNCEATAWCPGPDWESLPGAEGRGTVGVWRVRDSDGDWIVKRVRHDTSNADPRSYLWAQREIEVARSGIASQFKGLAAPDYRVEVDADGASLWSRFVTHEPPAPTTVAQALAIFSSAKVSDPGWFVTGRLRDRIAATDSGGAERLRSTLDRELGELVCQIWDRRDVALHLLDKLPQVLSHGDALPRNLLRHDLETDRVVAIDWDQIGLNAVGADLATYWMWTPVEACQLVSAYTDALVPGTASRHEVDVGFALTIALIAVMRAVRSEGAEGYHDRLVRARGQLEVAARLVEGPVDLVER